MRKPSSISQRPGPSVMPAGRPKVLAFLTLFAFLSVPGAALAYQGYFMSPDIHGNHIAFAAEGDLWLCNVDGSNVHRLTTHPGTESSPRFSPDGAWIAFDGEYDGNRDVYVVSSQGCEPRRLTWHPGPEVAVGWTPDGQKVIFSSRRDDPHGDEQLYTASYLGGDPEKLPLGRANWIDIDRETGRWAFTRVWGGGTWKRYRGGRAPEIWEGDPARADFHEVTHFDGIDLYPMWHDGKIFFLSDKGGTANLWSMNADGSERVQLTAFDTWDARNPAMGPDGSIVFSLAGDIHLFDPDTGREHAIPIDLPSERVLTRERYPDAAKYLSEFALAPGGDRVLVIARGEVFSVPVEKGVTLPITRGSGARECRASFDPQGERVVYVTDESREEAIATADAWGRGDVKTVKAAGASGWHFPPRWSPDGKWLAYADQTHSLYVIDANGGAPRKVDYCEPAEIDEYAWSPDGRWLAYTKMNDAFYRAILIYDVKENETHQVTGWETDTARPPGIPTAAISTSSAIARSTPWSTGSTSSRSCSSRAARTSCCCAPTLRIPSPNPRARRPTRRRKRRRRRARPRRMRKRRRTRPRARTRRRRTKR